MTKTYDIENPDEYNGWTNRETWVVNLWLSNEEPLYRDALEVVAQAIADGRKYATEHGWEPDANSGKGLAMQRLESYVDELIGAEYDAASMLTDLINSALGRVDWAEIVAAFAPEEVTA